MQKFELFLFTNMKLGDNTLNIKRLSLVNTKYPTKNWLTVALILLCCLTSYQ